MKKILFLSIFFLISVFIGYENPKLVEKPKNYIKFHLKNMNLIDNFAVDKIEIKETEKEKYKIEEKNQVIVEGNSYNLILNNNEPENLYLWSRSFVIYRRLVVPVYVN